ncbi:NitT/TauT family transport system substrate-binding protein [Rhizobiales bacterium GAS191]|nr:NitT/TauT family transport system substrate-binding protein [Rhizobiales bacterium GAS113]SEC64363.1 NitT/TauT family transport system substrate-binding protein [Rhizobiales bacterium GAS191]
MVPALIRRCALGLAAAVALAAVLPGVASAETLTVRLAKQFGISYLPLTIMEKKGLLEAQGKKLGLDLKTEWVQFTGGAPMNDALISGSLDIVSGGVGPMLVIWGKTRSSLGVKGIAALNSMPLYLNTSNPNVKTVKDFSEKDKIALPTVKVSIQAITLQMAAEKLFGEGKGNQLDAFTVSMGHPDAQAALMGGKTEIDAHFGAAPYQYDELKDARIHKVLDSYEVMGGSHSFNVIWTTAKYHDRNPLVMKAFLAALGDAMRMIADDPADAAALFIADERSKMAQDEVVRIIKLPENEWTMTPKKITVYADFMARTGLLAAKPASWKDLFFPEIHDLPGS